MVAADWRSRAELARKERDALKDRLLRDTRETLLRIEALEYYAGQCDAVASKLEVVFGGAPPHCVLEA